MSKRQARLSDKFDLGETHQLLTGAQAIVRLTLMQKARDKAQGLNTAGYVTGYRGSPIATLENVFSGAKSLCEANDILFHPGLNEDLAATAVWGTQQAELKGEGRYDGVFAIWYGKGPGVDRSGDAFRHANHAGTSRHGGVVALMGDDHTCESSTSAHQSEFAFVDAMIPILNPAGVQEIIDYGIIGFALSRYAGIWVGVKCVKDNMESTATVDGRLDRVAVRLPTAAEFAMPPAGLNIRLGDQPLEKEARLHDWKRAAIIAFSRANGLDRIMLSGGSTPKVGIVTSGKTYLDVRQALDELGIDEIQAAKLGIRLLKVAMSWPLEPSAIAKFAQDLDLILVVEEKRSLIETQIKEQLFDLAARPRVLGKKDEEGRWLFPAKGALDPLDIAAAIGRRVLALLPDEALAARVAEVERLIAARPHDADLFPRIPYFCAGCPHNTSTVVPAGSRALAGIGCHYMALWMDRSTEGFTQMGGEGANWIGEAPFSKREHVFQNMGDGTYIHSGSLAIRAAVAAGVSMTFKVLYNDAVAMTGGQKLDAGISVAQVAAQALAEGVARVDVVTDEPEKYGQGDLPEGVAVHHRRDLDQVQRALAATPGVTALIYDQTCAAEKRRRRKRGLYPDPDKRVFINPAVCEGCGDCGRKSNCVAVVPLETELGRKRAIDQSACNKDFSCLEGFCPSFVTLVGAKPRKKRAAGDRAAPPPSWGKPGVGDGRPTAIGTASATTVGIPPTPWIKSGAGSNPSPQGGGGSIENLADVLPEPTLPALDKPYAVLVTGIGGTGVVTVSAVLAQAAHLAGLGFGAIDVTGLAQKGGAVACHMRIAARAEDIHAIRIGTGHADLVLGGDLVVTASNKVLDSIRRDHTAVVHSTHEITTGDFTRNANLAVPGVALAGRIAAHTGRGDLTSLDAQAVALAMFGDSLYANMLLAGLAYQEGHLPIPAAAIEEAIRLNGAAVEQNLEAFRLGRLAAVDRERLLRLAGMAQTAVKKPRSLEEIVAFRAGELTQYQDAALADRYRAKVAWAAELERTRAPGRSGLAEAVARSYFKLLAYKDEYEVARLFSDGRFEAMVAREFEGVRKIQFHLAPPLLARRNASTGEPRKITFGPWMLPLFRLLAKGKRLRGTRWDLFGYLPERRRERQMIADYEALLEEIAERLTFESHAAAVALASLPLEVRGFGHVKAAAERATHETEARLRAELLHPAPVRAAAE